MNKWFVLTIILAINFFFLACKYSSFKEEYLLKEAVKENENFGVKIRAFRQKAFIGADGVDYQIQVKNVDDAHWKEIMIVHHDDGIEFGEKNIILVNSSVGFVFISDGYSFTLDKGKSWKDSRLMSEDPSCMIDNVKLESDGKGTMTLICNGKQKELITTNFGAEWGK